jgi:hypothetical protein
MNRGEADSKRAEKTREANRLGRYFREGATHPVDGFAVVDWRCLTCGTVNQASRETAGTTRGYCRRCRTERLQERVR